MRERDPLLRGVYVRRCKCGCRPYLDRVIGRNWWIACNCGRFGIVGCDILQAIKNWNNGLIDYERSRFSKKNIK